MKSKYKKAIHITGKIMAALLLSASGIVVISVVTIYCDGTFNSKWIVGICGEVSLLIYSLLWIFILSRGNFSSYGFSGCRGARWKTIVAMGIGIGIIMGLIGYLSGLNELAPRDNYSFLQSVVVIWIFASISEEVLMRGLVQSYLSPLRSYSLKIASVRLSAPVAAAALMFAFIHITLLSIGADISYVAFIMMFTFLVGLTAGYYREKTGSIVPAFVIHFMANAGGSLIGYFK